MGSTSGDRGVALGRRVRPSLRSDSSYGPCGPAWTGASFECVPVSEVANPRCGAAGDLPSDLLGKGTGSGQPGAQLVGGGTEFVRVVVAGAAQS